MTSRRCSRRCSFSTYLDARAAKPSDAHGTFVSKKRRRSLWASCPAFTYGSKKVPHPALMMDDVLGVIMEHLDERTDLVSAASCCSQWRLASERKLWTQLKLDTRIPGAICKYTKLNNLPQAANFELHDVIDLEYLCSPKDTTRLQLLLCILHTSPNHARRVRSVSLHLECYFTSFVRHNRNYIDFDEEDLTPEVKEAAWQMFLSRAGLCVRMLKMLPRLEEVNIVLDVHLEQSWKAEFDNLIFELTDVLWGADRKCQKLKNLSFSIGPNAVLPDAKAIKELFKTNNLGSAIRSFCLSSWHTWPAVELTNILQIVGPLESVILENNVAINCLVLQAIIPHAKTLRRLVLSNAQRVADDVLFDQVLPIARNLVELTLEGAVVTWAHSASQRYILGCRALRHLNVNRCIRLPSGFFDAVASTCPLLEVLFARDVPTVTDAHVRDLVNNCPRLSSIDLSRCENLGISALEHIADVGLIKLRRLNVQGCPRIVEFGGARVATRMAETCANMQQLQIGPVHQKPLTAGWRMLANVHRLAHLDHLGAIPSPACAVASLLTSHCDRYVTLDVSMLRKYLEPVKGALRELEVDNSGHPYVTIE